MTLSHLCTWYYRKLLSLSMECFNSDQCLMFCFIKHIITSRPYFWILLTMLNSLTGSCPLTEVFLFCIKCNTSHFVTMSSHFNGGNERGKERGGGRVINHWVVIILHFYCSVQTTTMPLHAGPLVILCHSYYFPHAPLHSTMTLTFKVNR